jgi:hypothetical protein
VPEQSPSSRTAVAPRDRVSLYSISTDSTKLGEIPQRKLHRRRVHEADQGKCMAQAAYPIRPFAAAEVREQKKSCAFWRR